MASQKTITIKSAGKKRVLNAMRDVQDIRDRWYEPSLVALKKVVDNRKFSVIRDQGEDGACTGFGLAAAIDILNSKNNNPGFTASTRMLYDMAKRHDEWPGYRYSGSSCRGAIKGWKNMGVCSEKNWPYTSAKNSELTIARAKAARNNTLGAYYRLRPEVSDYHSALNEVDAIYVSADVHDGWWEPKKRTGGKLALITPSSEISGGHAFCIVGYNDEGFLVQNSWGKNWGSAGFALWPYEDWLDNICDGWVFRLAVSTPSIFGITSRASSDKPVEFLERAPRRLEIAGHFAHFDDGVFKTKGDYWTTADDIQLTATKINDEPGKYQHLLVYAHGGLNSPKASATRIAKLKDGFMRNGIYPYHMMYDTGIAEEVKDAVLRAVRGQTAQNILTNLRDKLIEHTDNLIEDVVRKPVTPLWGEMKRDARLPWVHKSAAKPGDGETAIAMFAAALKGSTTRLHLAGHSTGAVLLGHLLGALDALGEEQLVSSCSLMAPACTIDFYQEHYAPRLGKTAAGSVSLPALDIYNLVDELELDDQVAGVYRKSLLYLVSRALEREENKPLLGMEKYSSRLEAHKALKISYSDGKKGNTRSTSHGGFDNDMHTMNNLLQRILGAAPKYPFTEKEMKGY